MALPVIVSDVPGPNSYATDANAYLIPTLPGTRPDGLFEINVTALIDIMQEVVLQTKVSRGHDDITSSSSCCRCLSPKTYSGKGLEARKTMQAISSEHVADKIAERIKILVAERGWEEI